MKYWGDAHDFEKKSAESYHLNRRCQDKMIGGEVAAAYEIPPYMHYPWIHHLFKELAAKALEKGVNWVDEWVRR